MRESKLQGSVEPKPLYLARNFEDLSKLVSDDIIRGLKIIHRLPGIARRMVVEIHQFQNDQERVYIIGKRYLKVMDHFFAHTEDKMYLELRYGSEYRQMQALVCEVEDDLRARYNSMATFKQEEYQHMKEIGCTYVPSSESSGSDRVYLKPTEEPPEKAKTVVVEENPIFSAQEVAPVELFNAMMMKRNILVVDTRPTEEFAESKINMQDSGKLINVPQDIIILGLSANTLGQLLDEETQDIWNNRDTFEAIVLMDWDTDSINFMGSKLERLRNIIVEWDFNRSYRQDPVLLNGGYKEFVEWYPSEVTNSLAYLSQTNSEIDELLTIDDVSYPEVGSAAGNMKLKVHTISSFVDVQARVARDFGDIVEPGSTARPSKSEGQLPKDFYVQAGKSPYKSLSEESLPKDFIGVETPEPLPIIEPKVDEDIDEEIKSTIAGNRAELLKEARALKPKPNASPRAEPAEVIIRNLIEENKDLFVKPAAPSVDRTFKPAQVHHRLGEGYTGIRNLRNNCYVSCMLQCLKVIPVIKAMFVTSNGYIEHIHRNPPVIVIHFASVMKVLWEGNQKRPKTYYPQVLLQKIYDMNKVYAKGNHEDTFEFFIFLFNRLSEDCSVELPRPKIMTEQEKSWYSQLQGRTSCFIDLTYYQLKNTRTCWNCQKPSYVFDSDSTLMLPVPERKEHGSLEYLLKEYMKENLVAEYSCAECKSTATIVNRKEIVLDPEILIIVLKRYTANLDGTFRKNETEVSFPTDNLGFGNSLYKLYSVPQHSGTMLAGHYYASALVDDEKDHWVMFNDERAIRHNVPITQVPGIKSACVGFFYVRQGAKN